MSNESILGGLNNILQQAIKEREEFFKTLTDEQKILYNDFDANLNILIKVGDKNGIRELIEKFNKKNDELQRNTAKVQQRVPKWRQFLNKSYNRFFRRSKG